MNLKLFTLGLIVLFLSSCSKNKIETDTNLQSSKVIKIGGVLFAKNSPSPNLEDPTRKYAEGVCSVRVDTVDVPGTICYNAYGNKCKTVTNCIPVSSAAISGQYSKEEIDQKIILV